MADVELRTLGECQVIVRGERIGPQSPHAFALSLYLCIERGRPHPREALLSLFFPEADIDKGRHSLRQSLYKLRQVGLPCDTTTAGTIVPAAAVHDDFTSLLATAELPDLPAGRLPGEFLPGYWPKLSLEYTRWLEAQRDAVNSALRRAYIARIADRRSVARWDQVERYARACLEVDPLNEEATLALAEALALSGSKAAGVKVLDDYLVEVGSSGTPLTLPAATLRRRISERVVGRRASHDLPLIGRDDEMRILDERVAQARSGAQSTLWLQGEPGIGKSRLLREFAMRMSLSGVGIVVVSSQSLTMPQSLSTVSEAVEALIRLPGALGTSSEALSILRSVCRLDAKDATRDKSVGLSEISPMQLVTSFCDLVDAVCTEQTLMLAFDDFQWADDLSQVLVSALCESVRTRRLMLLLVSRELPPANMLAATTTVRIPGLRRFDAVEMLHAGFARNRMTVADHLIDHAVDLASGNPFFLQAMIDHLISNPATTDLPVRLLELIRTRVSSVSPIAGMVLRCCALFGRHATLDRVSALLELPRHELASGLKELEDAGLVIWEKDIVSISHALISDFVIGERASASTSLLYAAAGEMLEQEARAAGSSALYWSADACWERSGNHVAAARCASEARTLDNLSALVSGVDWAVAPKTADAILDESSGCSFSASQLVAFAKETRNTAGARVRAAVGALAIAEDSCDAALALSAYEAALSAGSGLTGNAQADIERAALAYHTFFGDKAAARALIDSIEKSFSLRPDRYAAARTTQNAAEALCHCGDVERGLALFESCFQLASLSGNDEGATNAAVHAIWFARQVGNKSAVALWSTRVRKSVEADKLVYRSYAYNEALLALDSTDVDQFRRFAFIVESARYGVGNNRVNALVDALALRRTMIEGSVPDGNTTSRLHRWCLDTAAFHPADDVAAAVALAHGALAAHATAAVFLTSYFTVRRRDTFQCLAQLRDLAADFGVTEDD